MKYPVRIITAEEDFCEIWISEKTIAIPSTSNTKKIRRSKHGGIYLGNSDRAQRAFDALLGFLMHERKRLNISFEKQRVSAFVVLCNRPTKNKAPTRFDSHNYSKPIGDLLERAGFFSDDTNAEIFCIKASDYDLPNEGITKIRIYARKNVKNRVLEFFECA